MYKITDVELHKKGINVVCNDLTAQGYEVIDYNHDPHTVPQILAKKNGQICKFLVTTERLPNVGKLDAELARGLTNSSLNDRFLMYFVSVGIEDLGEQSRVATSDLQLLTLDAPLPTDEQYVEHYPTRVRVDRAPKFPDLFDVKVVWRAGAHAIVESGDWRFNQWEGLFKGFNEEKNTVMIRFTDERIAPDIREFWYKTGFNDPLFSVPAPEVWLADDEIFKLAPQITPAEIRQLKPDAPPLKPDAPPSDSSQTEQKKSWWKVW